MIFVIYLVLCIIISVVLSSIGYGIDTWQWWVCCGCIWLSYSLGRFYEYCKTN